MPAAGSFFAVHLLGAGSVLGVVVAEVVVVVVGQPLFCGVRAASAKVAPLRVRLWVPSPGATAVLSWMAQIVFPTGQLPPLGVVAPP